MNWAPTQYKPEPTPLCTKNPPLCVCQNYHISNILTAQIKRLNFVKLREDLGSNSGHYKNFAFCDERLFGRLQILLRLHGLPVPIFTKNNPYNFKQQVPPKRRKIYT